MHPESSMYIALKMDKISSDPSISTAQKSGVDSVLHLLLAAVYAGQVLDPSHATTPQTWVWKWFEKIHNKSFQKW